jgi:hypothetical protein
MGLRSNSRLRRKLMVALSATVVALFGWFSPAISTEPVSEGERFVVTRDFGPITLDPAVAKGARVFIEPIRLVSAEENAELHPFAIRLLATRVTVVPDQQNSDYFVRFILKDLKNYSIGNTLRQPSTGFMAAGICKFPIKDQVHDCETLTYYYFSNEPKSGLFKEIVPLWINSIFPETPR